MTIYKVTTNRTMQLTPEVVELIMKGENPYDHIEPTGPIITHVAIVGTR
ncbi:MAG: hypothetical protein QNK37_37230 [Acidobacteriota bacterium]|nr:hypothetical protein [Acidobacteriota bacterium]